jgi:hypothetical protein
MNRLLRTSAWCVSLGAIALCAVVPAGAATKTTKKSTKKVTKATKTAKRVATPAKIPTATAAPTTVPAATLAPTTVATTTAAPTTVAPTTAAPTTVAATTTAAPTTVAAPAYDYILRVTQPTQKAAPGSTVSFIVVAEAKAGTLGPVTLLPVGIPAGVSATLDQNPIVSAGEMKFILPATLAVGFYEVKINGISNGIGRSVTATIVVEGAAVSTTTTTTIAGTTTTTRPTYKYSVVVAYPAGTLSTGGTLSYPIVVNRDPGNNDTITLSTSNLPTNVWAGFSDNPIAKDSTMWISSTLPLTKGNYTFNLVISSVGTSQLIPIQLTIV